MTGLSISPLETFCIHIFNFGHSWDKRQFTAIILSSSALTRKTRPLGADQGAEDGFRTVLEKDLQSMESLKSQARLNGFTSTFHFHALEKEMATHFSVLAWRIPGTAEPGGLPSMGSHRARHD